ncbi:aquaporin SIP2-1 isoform X3 [Elaeis guineensis]|uniref:aquaporin SIP2-1 isoform X3 n=1 Tax=Elaeis guineensis var. tenera TaxID=51953 RepID=UPI003C6CFB28
MARFGLVLWDSILSFMWVWASALVKLFVYGYLELGHRPEAEILKISLGVLYMFFFAWLGEVTRGGSYNPLTVLSYAFSGNLDRFLFTALGRIPAQVIGSIVGVRLIKAIFPEIGQGPRLSVDIHRGALTEGLLTFMVVMVSMGLKKKDPKSFFMKTWISSIAKITLHILGSDLTGGIMNPASYLDGQGRLASGLMTVLVDGSSLSRIKLPWLGIQQLSLGPSD